MIANDNHYQCLRFGCNEKLKGPNQYCNKHALELVPRMKEFIESRSDPLERDQ